MATTVVLCRAGEFIKQNIVMCIAVAAATVTAFFVPPDEAYASYFDFKTLACLFSTLAVVCALKQMRFFYKLAQTIVQCFTTLRLAALALVCVTFLGSMLIANDMALLTFLPLGYYVLMTTGQDKHMAILFILQNIAANLGGMLTPFGNPQNLYLYSYFQIPDGEFVSIMAPSFAVSVALIALCCFVFFPHARLTVHAEKIVLPPVKCALCLALFALSIVMVFRLIPYGVGLAIIVASLLLIDRKALTKVDYPLLFTFFFFFIFAGNMGRIEFVRGFFSALLARNTLLVSALSCQVISNVPSAILLSRFTDSYAPLLVGVNIGGCGTIISSLASLITFRTFTMHNRGKAGAYLLVFSAFNFAFLFILLLLNMLW
ncbi:MAG: citrate transporter [Clostridia bacterium]|nr:citrate transporter [Clostridia bacterium]